MISIQLRRIVVGVVLSSIAAGSIGCDRNDDDAETLPDGELVYEDDFERDEIGDDWEAGGDHWRIEEGQLNVQGARNDGLWLQRPLPEEFRVRFTAQSGSEEGDIKFEILGDGSTHESGYIGIFGGWHNSLNVIARLDEHGDDRLEGADEMRVEPGRVYQMDVVRTDQRLRWFVDGELFLSYDDSDPLSGDEHRHFAFNNYTAPLVFDELRIYDVSGQGD